jgi:hypothetical protein
VSAHTIDEALKFKLIAGAGSEDEGTACVMTALSWVAGEAWSDRPACAHPLLASLAIRANDADGTTTIQRRALLRAGVDGIIDTWWVPAEVILHCLAAAEGDGVKRTVNLLKNVAKWKATSPKAMPDLRGADLGGANLRDANLRGTNLGYANLRGTNLGGANLRGADLRGAYLRYADLGGAYLGGAYLRDADLRGADLGGANLEGADLRGADLRGADLGGANLGGANLGGANLGDALNLTLPPGWKLNASGLAVRA